MKRILFILMAAILCLSLCVPVAAEDTRRPVWIMKHKCNSADAIAAASKARFNAIEVDVRCDSLDQCRMIYENNQPVYTDCFFLAHNDAWASSDVSIHELFRNPALHGDNAFTVIMLDIKTPEYMKELNDAVHHAYEQYFGGNEARPYVIYSVAEYDEMKYYAPSTGFVLYENEGVCVDYCNDASAVNASFQSYGYDRCWYGNGIFSGESSANITDGCAAAVNIRDFMADSAIKKVERWTVQTEAGLYESLVEWRCDSVMTDQSISDVPGMLAKSSYDWSSVRLATKNDSPFEKVPYRYVRNQAICFTDYNSGDYVISGITFQGNGKDSVVTIDHSDSSGTGSLSVTFDNCQFINCGTKDSDGSCVYVNNIKPSDRLIFKNTTVSNCVADYGPFLYINDEDAVVDGSGSTTISNCYADSCGGAIAVNDDAVTISGFTFSSCRADTDGGAIHFFSASTDCKVSGCTFNYCEAVDGDGGAICICHDSTRNVIENCTFNGCFCDDDGQYVYGNDDEDVTVTGCTQVPDNYVYYYDCTVVPGLNGYSASTISEGNIWILAAIAGAAVLGLTALVIVKKKKEAE